MQWRRAGGERASQKDGRAPRRELVAVDDQEEVDALRHQSLRDERTTPPKLRENWRELKSSCGTREAAPTSARPPPFAADAPAMDPFAADAPLEEAESPSRRPSLSFGPPPDNAPSASSNSRRPSLFPRRRPLPRRHLAKSSNARIQRNSSGRHSSARIRTSSISWSRRIRSPCRTTTR